MLEGCVAGSSYIIHAHVNSPCYEDEALCRGIQLPECIALRYVMLAPAGVKAFDCACVATDTMQQQL